MSYNKPVSVSAIIDNSAVGRFQLRVVLLCALVVALDGFDAQILGYIAPALGVNWNLPAGALGPVFGIGLFGMMIGALVFGPVADRVGRKKVIICATFFFGVCTLATVTAETLSSLAGWRFLTGIGLGGAYPNAIALTSEFSPKRRRAMLVMLMFLGFGVGSAAGGAVAALLLDVYGWKSMLWVGGIVPVVVAFVLIRVLPESPTFLVVQGSKDNKIRPIVQKVDPALRLPEGTHFVVNETSSERTSVRHLFADGRSLGTLMLWIMFSGGLFNLYFLMAWLPTIIHELNVSMKLAALITANMQVAITLATLLVALFADKVGVHRILPVLYFMAAVFIASIGLAGATTDSGPESTTALVAIVVFGAGFFVGGGQNSANALVSIFYPTFIRSTGVSWGHGVARVASILGPVVGGAMIASRLEIRTMFYVAAVPMVCAGIASVIFRYKYSSSLSDTSVDQT